MQVKREAKIYARQLPSGNTTFRVDMGMLNGKRQTKDFKTESEAQKLKSKWDAEIQRKHLGALQDLAAVNKREILLALERLQPFNASILEAVDFYIRFAMPVAPDLAHTMAGHSGHLVKSSGCERMNSPRNVSMDFGSL